MFHIKPKMTCFGLVIAAAVIIGCRADLLPVGWGSQPGPYKFCMKDVNDDLVIVIKNKGSVDAPQSTTKVDFLPGGAFSLPTPGIPAGDSIDLRVTIPETCFQPECQFRITADADNQVNESNEANNVADGKCAP